jgi:ferredoxin-like protein FixX
MTGVSIVERSADRKLSADKNVSATWVSQATCHDDCPLKKNGCYAESFNAGIQTHRLNREVKQKMRKNLRDTRLKLAKAEAAGIATLSGKRKLRVHVVGDCATAETAGIVGQAMVDYQARSGKKAWTYTHSWRRFGAKAWKGANVLASCERPEQVAQAKAHGYATVLIVPDHPTNKVYNYQGVNILPCPAQFYNSKDAGDRTVTCEKCNICQSPEMLKKNNLTVGFQSDLRLMKKKIYKIIGLTPIGTPLPAAEMS